MTLGELWEWIKAGLPLLVAGGILTIGAQWWGDSKKRKRGARYLAISLAVNYETYALECADQINKLNLFESSHGNAGERNLSLPKVLPIPESAHWENLEHDLTERAFTFPNVVRQASGYIDFEIEMNDDPEFAGATISTIEKAGITGLMAWQLASDLRRRYRITPFRKEDIGWDFIALLTNEKNKAEQRRAALVPEVIVD